VPASPFVKEVDAIQRALKPALAEHGYRARGRTFNRLTDDGLTHVVNLQTGASDPPGTTCIPGLRENLHGLFTINLGVYIPEDAGWRGLTAAKSWVQYFNCSIRERLGLATGSVKDIWWQARCDADVVADVQSNLLSYGLMFLARFESRDEVLRELKGHGANLSYCAVPRVVSATILAERGDKAAATELMAAQAGETLNRHHPAYVRGLAKRMGLGEI
jgi:hypothetical protein